ncbi:MAG: S1 RNA-binding domain-containing protein [Chloroflexota bacterium]|jgi:ribosomal protein S1|nr:S1 RNA-binding domain-containing protein [Chloroflexota bacterium]
MEQQEIKAKERYTGTVLKTTLQGALVDIGSEKPAFIHISQAVKDGDPKIEINSIEEVLEKGQKLEFFVKRIRKDRIELTMKEPLGMEWREIKPGMTVNGQVVRLETFGAFVDIGAERPGLIHISELSHSYVRTPGEVVREGDEVEAKVLEVNRRKKQIKLSIKALQELPENLQMRQRGGKKKQKEEPKEPELTAMEIAMRQAMEKADGDEKVDSSKKKSRKNKEASPEQEEILSRTLENKVGQDS